MTNGWTLLPPVKWPIFVQILVVSLQKNDTRIGNGSF